MRPDKRRLPREQRHKIWLNRSLRSQAWHRRKKADSPELGVSDDLPRVPMPSLTLGSERPDQPHQKTNHTQAQTELRIVRIEVGGSRAKLPQLRRRKIVLEPERPRHRLTRSNRVRQRVRPRSLTGRARCMEPPMIPAMRLIRILDHNRTHHLQIRSPLRRTKSTNEHPLALRIRSCHPQQSTPPATSNQGWKGQPG